MKLFIPLSQGQIAWISEEDYDRVSKYPWTAGMSQGIWYAYSPWYLKYISMHRFILNITDPKVLVDHRDWDGLNNTRENIREATKRQNAINSRLSSKIFRGVRERPNGKYQSRIKIETGRLITIGTYTTAVEAAKAYDEAAKKYHGEFAVLNFGD